MNIRRLSYGLILTLSTAVVAVGCGETPPPEAPPQPTAEPAPPPPPPSATAEAAPPAPTASATAEAPPPPPPEKKASEKVVGKWAQALEGDLKDAATKKFEKAKDKDKKLAAEADKLKEHTLEFTADTFTESTKGKPVHSFKYKIGKNDAGSMTFTADGKDLTTKKDAPKGEMTVTFSDDNTFSMKDPTAKDQAKAATLVYKRQ
jgi:type IV secretory pathway VirB10-like protein